MHLQLALIKMHHRLLYTGCKVARNIKPITRGGMVLLGIMGPQVRLPSVTHAYTLLLPCMLWLAHQPQMMFSRAVWPGGF